MNDQYLSMKEIADLLKVSKQRVYRCIKDNCINEAHHEVVRGNNVYKYDSAAVAKIKEILDIKDSGSDETVEAHQETVEKSGEAHQKALYEALLKQLEVKDQQIADQKKLFEQQLQNKDDQISMLQKLLDQEQHLHGLSQKRVLELEDLQKAAEVKMDSESESDSQERSADGEDQDAAAIVQPDQKKPWWKFW